ncbi:MAG: restriction endonuclease subunit S [Nitrospirae bacterium]|nr:restriction endonuclease subunit S [Nitrospirota bacterium]
MSEDDEGASKHIVLFNSEGIPFISGLHTIVSKSKNDIIDNRYKRYCFQPSYVKSQFKFYAVGTKVTGISKTNIAKILIPLPPSKAEQTAIAAALSDADVLISSLEKLIAKKRNIKQGAMQELLTGKKRLPGFRGEWEVKRLGGIFNVTAGGDFDYSLSSSIQDETYCYPIYSNAISEKGLYGYSSYNDHNADSITVTARGTLGIANYRDHKFTAIGRVLILEPKEAIDGRFFSEFINNRIDFVVESTGVPQLTAPQIFKCELPVPPFAEQTAIAQILSDMDAEIDKLEQKLAKYRMIKQGMMQELLTGRIRIV